jgi:hypothetical protein
MKAGARKHNCIREAATEMRLRECPPSDEQGLVQAVEHIDDHIVVGGDIHDRAWELLVDCNNLKQETGKRRVRDGHIVVATRKSSREAV